jgi:pimeloyl-ACP methyl ester carboxylesterase
MHFAKNFSIIFHIFVLFIVLEIHANIEKPSSVFILVHGTWGAECSWYAPKGDFFDALEATVSEKNSVVVSFRWSGGCGHDSRVKAAQSLVKLIKTYDVDMAIFVVAHSHGGTVAVLASQLLAQEVDNKHNIRALFTLGTPVMSNYLPNMKIIHYLYNLFSFEDLVQPVLGISSREYPEHRRIANLRVIVDGKEPDHTGIHHPIIGKWIAYVHQYFKQYLHNKDIINHISEPSIVYFDENKAPEYAYDIRRDELMERDRQLSVLILNSLRNSLDTESNIPLTNL